MAEVDTSIYRTQPQDPLKQPLAIMQLLGAVNQNKLFNQTYDSREKVGQAYQQSIGPDGKIDNTKLRSLIKDAGFGAGEAIGQANTNETGQFNLDSARLQRAQQLYAPLAANSKVTLGDVNNFSVRAAKLAGIPTETITAMNDGAREAFKAGGSKGLQKYLATTGTLSLGIGALNDADGKPNEEGQVPKIPVGQAIQESIQPGGRVTANAPGYQEAASIGGTALGQARARAANFGADLYPMQQALPALERLGTTKTGPGTGELNTVKSFIQSNLNWLPGADKIVGNPNDIKDFDEATKYLTNIAGARAGSFGHGTDQALSTALTASPNTHISNLAAVDLTKATIALRRMEQAQTLQADAENVSPGKYGTWAARWATNVDPRAFMIDVMTPDQMKNLNDKLKNPAERAKFNRTVKMAIDNGIITRPGGEHAPGE